MDFQESAINVGIPFHLGVVIIMFTEQLQLYIHSTLITGNCKPPLSVALFSHGPGFEF